MNALQTIRSRRHGSTSVSFVVVFSFLPRWGQGERGCAYETFKSECSMVGQGRTHHLVKRENSRSLSSLSLVVDTNFSPHNQVSSNRSRKHFFFLQERIAVLMCQVPPCRVEEGWKDDDLSYFRVPPSPPPSLLLAPATVCASSGRCHVWADRRTDEIPVYVHVLVLL